MKKLLTIILSVLMLCTIASTSVFAEDNTQDTVVTFTVPATFEWSVPETLTVGDTNGGTISISNFNHGPAQFIGISVESFYGFKVSGGTAGKFDYDLLIDGEAINSESTYIARLDDYKLQVKVTANWKDGTEAPTTPGTYEDLLTFTAIVDHAY